MGCDIHGYLEVKRKTHWHVIKEVPSERTYDTFGVLFGVRNYVDAVPIAPERGIPDDVSHKVKKAVERWCDDGHSSTWLNVQDLLEYDWEQKSTDTRISTIDKLTGEERGKASYTHLQDKPEEAEKQGVYLKYLERRAGDAVSSTWIKFIDDMKALAEGFGNEGVRVVVWFDN